MAPSRSLLVWMTLLSLLLSIASAVALPNNDDHKLTSHVTKTITVTATSVQTCSTPKSFGTTSSHSSIPTSCPSIATQITKTVTVSSTVTVTSRPTSSGAANDPKTITVTKTDTVTSLVSGSKGVSTTVAPSTVTITRTVASNAIALASTITVTVTAPQSGAARTVTTTVSASKGTITVTSDIATTVTATTTVAPTMACPNILINPGFEDGTTGWAFNQVNPGITFAVQSSSSIPGGAHSGSYAGAFISNSGPLLPGVPSDIYQSFANINAACGTSGKYQISGFVKTASNQCYINIYNSGGGQTLESIQLLPGGTNPPWTEFAAVVDAPLTSLSNFVFEAACNTQDPVWFDDFSIVPTS